MRSALAEPIKGLGLSFGTSVAGVAASAMLGLMSAICRRERLELARALDGRIAGVLRPFSLAQQRDDTLRALQAQAGAVPEVLRQIETLMERIDRRTEQLDTQLLQRQAEFQREAAVAYTGLAQAVGTSLQDSLVAGARAAGTSIQPVMEAAMAQIVQETHRLQEHLREQARAQADVLARSFDTRSTAVLAAVHDGFARAQAEQAGAEQLRQAAWTASLQDLAGRLHGQWQQVGEQAAAHEAAVTRALAQAEELVRSRVASEEAWATRQGERMDQLAGLWRTQLEALRQEEAARGQAAVDRLGELQANVTQNLATLGAALEAPLGRLLQTASEVPQAAASMLAQLRREMSGLAERDNAALQERGVLLEKIGALLHDVNQASAAQRGAIESLVTSAATLLEQAGVRFKETMEAHGGQAADMAVHVNASAVELASLGEAFGQGVQLFQATNEKLLEGLQRIEQSIDRSTARSDEQLAYYVAQAREVIDLSIASQHGLVDNLRQLQVKPAIQPAGAAG
jgi:hypothetical protein